MALTQFTPDQIIAEAQRLTPAGGDVRNTLLTYGQSQGYSNSQMDQMLGLQPGETAAYSNGLLSPTPAAPAAPAAPASSMSTFKASSIPGAGSYNTEDYLSLGAGALTGGVTGALAGAAVNQSIDRLQKIGETGLEDYTNLGKAVTSDINFTPYTVTTSLGTTNVNPDGSISSTLSPGVQANVDAATKAQGEMYDFSGIPDTSGLSQGALTAAETQLGAIGSNQEDLANLRAGYGEAAQNMTGMLGGSTTDMANQLFEQQQAMRTPEQERQALALENRLRAQGRLGTTTAAYGGTPEQLAMAKAVQEQQAADAFNSMTQAEQMATSQQNRALGLGSATSALAQTQQNLTTGDIANTQGLFNIGSSAANLPLDMKGKQVNMAGQLQNQVLAPAAAQLNQVQTSGTLGAQAANTEYNKGSLFANTVGTGLQERLTAETAATAARTKQYDSLLKSANATQSEADSIQSALSQGIKKVGENLFDAAGKFIGKAADVLGTAASDLWDRLANTAFDTDARFEEDWKAAMDAGFTSDDKNVFRKAREEFFSWFK